MHYLYLPVRIPSSDSGYEPASGMGTAVAIPERLAFLEPAIRRSINQARFMFRHLEDPYVYVTARRGFATPGNPLNRPGMHCDDFGGTDLNFIWSDAYPTRFLLADEPLNIRPDDAESMVDMQRHADMAVRNANPGTMAGYETNVFHNQRIVDGPLNTLLRLDPYVIHDTPVIEKPGMRSFFKISVSTHRYDLVGNSHNYDLDYDWPMYSREALRNQPSGGNSDYSGN